MPPFKKWNPGCNCCERVLIWDLGFPAGETGQFSFIDFRRTEELYEEIDVAIDSVTGLLNPPNTFYDVNPEWDPYVYAVENGFWTGDIRDYQLILWPYPLSDQNLDETTGPCPGPGSGAATPSGQPDHPLWGGLPQWWNDVLLGQWEGRLLWLTAGNTGREESTEFFPGFPINLFLNTLSDIHGMTMDESALSDQLDASTVAAVAASDLTAGVSNIGMSDITTRISGGEDVFLEGSPDVDLRTDPSWCVDSDAGTFVQAYPIAQRNRVLLPQDAIGIPQKTVDFVIAQFNEPILFPNPLATGNSIRPFLHNLFRVPVEI